GGAAGLLLALEHDQCALRLHVELVQQLLLRIEIDVEAHQILEARLTLESRQDRRLRLAGRTPGCGGLDQDRPAGCLRRLEGALVERLGIQRRGGRDNRKAREHRQAPKQMASIQHVPLPCQSGAIPWAAARNKWTASVATKPPRLPKSPTTITFAWLARQITPDAWPTPRRRP